ncbi:MAG TPA: Uma2 family endonuclease [Chthonomonadaceae bacterium]|nr:Uma2 family endonuclease [Chthonomonadaceae bacterium]
MAQQARVKQPPDILSDDSPETYITYEEFLAAADEDRPAEWVRGKVVYMAPVSDEHNRVGFFLLRLIGDFVEDNQLGAVRYESFQMKTGPNLPGREPDILFVANENLSRIKKNHLEGPADLVVEIVSPESRERDRVEKYREYEQGGVREYWLIDLERQEALFYRRNAQGMYEPGPIDENGIYESAVLPGLQLRVSWLWQRPLPLLREVQAERERS